MFVKPSHSKLKSRKVAAVVIGVLMLAGGSATVAGVASADGSECTSQRSGDAKSNRNNIHRDPIKRTEYVEHWCDVFRTADVVTHRQWNPEMQSLGQLPKGRHWFMCQEQWTDQPNEPTWNTPIPGDESAAQSGPTATAGDSGQTEVRTVASSDRPTRVSNGSAQFNAAASSDDRPTRVVDGNTDNSSADSTNRPTRVTSDTSGTSGSAEPTRTGKRNDNNWWLLAKAETGATTNTENTEQLDGFGWVPATHIRQGESGQKIPGVPECGSTEAAAEVREARVNVVPVATNTGNRNSSTNRPAAATNEKPQTTPAPKAPARETPPAARTTPQQTQQAPRQDRPQVQPQQQPRTPARSGDTLSDGSPRVIQHDDPRINDPIPLGEERIIQLPR